MTWSNGFGVFSFGFAELVGFREGVCTVGFAARLNSGGAECSCSGGRLCPPNAVVSAEKVLGAVLPFTNNLCRAIAVVFLGAAIHEDVFALGSESQRR